MRSCAARRVRRTPPLQVPGWAGRRANGKVHGVLMAETGVAADCGSVFRSTGAGVLERPFTAGALARHARRAVLALPIAMCVLARPAAAAADVHGLGSSLALWTVLPFALTLLAIAI